MFDRAVIVWQSVFIVLLLATCVFMNSFIMVREVNKEELHSMVAFCNSGYGGFESMSVQSNQIFIACADGTTNYLTR